MILRCSSPLAAVHNFATHTTWLQLYQQLLDSMACKGSYVANSAQLSGVLKMIESVLGWPIQSFCTYATAHSLISYLPPLLLHTPLQFPTNLYCYLIPAYDPSCQVKRHHWGTFSRTQNHEIQLQSPNTSD